MVLSAFVLFSPQPQAQWVELTLRSRGGRVVERLAFPDESGMLLPFQWRGQAFVLESRDDKLCVRTPTLDDPLGFSIQCVSRGVGLDPLPLPETQGRLTWEIALLDQSPGLRALPECDGPCKQQVFLDTPMAPPAEGEPMLLQTSVALVEQSGTWRASDPRLSCEMEGGDLRVVYTASPGAWPDSDTPGMSCTNGANEVRVSHWFRRSLPKPWVDAQGVLVLPSEAHREQWWGVELDGQPISAAAEQAGLQCQVEDGQLRVGIEVGFVADTGSCRVQTAEGEIAVPLRFQREGLGAL